MLQNVKPLGELDEAVLKKTLEERDAGWLEGPIPLSELEDHAVISRRFGIMQGSKMRVIDDYSMSGVNATVQVSESPKPHATGQVVALCLSLLANCGHQTMMGRTFDLKSAYRQLCIAPQSSWASYVACWDASAKAPKVFRVRALPFGASRAVYAFLRVESPAVLTFSRLIDSASDANTHVAHVVLRVQALTLKLSRWSTNLLVCSEFCPALPPQRGLGWCSRFGWVWQNTGPLSIPTPPYDHMWYVVCVRA